MAPHRRWPGTVAGFGFAVGPLIAGPARKLAGNCIDSSGFVARIDSATPETDRFGENRGLGTDSRRMKIKISIPPADWDKLVAEDTLVDHRSVAGTNTDRPGPECSRVSSIEADCCTDYLEYRDTDSARIGGRTGSSSADTDSVYCWDRPGVEQGSEPWDTEPDKPSFGRAGWSGSTGRGAAG